MKYLIVLTILFTQTAWAEDAIQSDKGTILSLSANSGMQVENDQLVANFRIEAEGQHIAELQERVNSSSRKVQSILSGYPDIQQQTTGRSLQPVYMYDKASGQQLRTGWRLVQNEQAVSKLNQDIPGWMDEIERAGAHLDGINFGVSQAVMEKALNHLRLQAVQAFRDKAAEMARALGATSFRILSLASDKLAPQGHVVQRALMVGSVDESAPAFNSGESRLTVSISGDILLPPVIFKVK